MAGQSKNFQLNIEEQAKILQGLKKDEVLLRRLSGAYNKPLKSPTRSVSRIVRDNFFTLFNFMNFVIAFFVIFASVLKPSLAKNLGFMVVVVTNLFIGIYQEVKAKHTVDRLSILVQPEVLVIREGEIISVPVQNLVIDDLIILQSGDQVPVDGILLKNDSLEVDESMLTGESDPIKKDSNEKVYSGSSVLAGSAILQVTEVSADTYAGKLSQEARKEKVRKSELKLALNKILVMVSIAIVPIGLALFLSKYWNTSGSTLALADTIVSASAALIGMIPEGLILLTEVAFAVGTVTLAAHSCFVQTMPAIEMLARIDSLCLDKTGTLTTGSMKMVAFDLLEEFGPMIPWGEEQLESFAASITALSDAKSGTQKALEDYFEKTPLRNDLKNKIPFSSARKWTAAHFEFGGTWFLGAAEYLLPSSQLEKIEKTITKHSSQGRRVLLLAYSELDLSLFEGKTIDSEVLDSPFYSIKPVGIFALEDTLRDDAKETLAYFRKQNVTPYLISGDNPETVAQLARRVDFENWNLYKDLSQIGDDAGLEVYKTLVEEYRIFGRVRPTQKKYLVQALQALGHTVAMTGDGVNDVPALKEADCSIAMCSGSQAAKGSSDIILLKNNLASLIPAVYEGRKIINNIERVATLFLVKTTYSCILSFLFIFIPSRYPIFPLQMSLISTASIGVPAFFLALRANKNRVFGNFIHKVLAQAIPTGLVTVLMILFLELFSYFAMFNDYQKSTVAVILLGTLGLRTLYRVSKPLNFSKSILILCMTSFFVSGLLFFGDFFFVLPIVSPLAFVYLPMVFFAIYLDRQARKYLDYRFFSRFLRKSSKV